MASAESHCRRFDADIPVPHSSTITLSPATVTSVAATQTVPSSSTWVRDTVIQEATSTAIETSRIFTTPTAFTFGTTRTVVTPVRLCDPFRSRSFRSFLRLTLPAPHLPYRPAPRSSTAPRRPRLLRVVWRDVRQLRLSSCLSVFRFSQAPSSRPPVLHISRSLRQSREPLHSSQRLSAQIHAR